MFKLTYPGTPRPGRAMASALAASLQTATGAQAADPGKAACMPDAKRLCSAEMKSLSRSKVRTCLIVHMSETSPTCHDFMAKARAEALSGRKPEPSAQ
jgi:hypothetical protein